MGLQIDWTTKKTWLGLWGALYIASLIYSPFTLSASMWCLAGFTFLTFTNKRFRWDWEAWGRMRQNLLSPAWWPWLLYALIPFIGFWAVEDPGYFWERIRIKIPFIVLPLSFAAMPAFTRRDVRLFWYIIIAIVFISSLGVLANYLAHMEEIHVAMERGQPMPTPRNHIRFSMLVVAALLGSIYWFFQRDVLRYGWERTLLGGVGVFLLVFIHILSVRSGLLAFYVSVLGLGCWLIVAKRRFLPGLVLVAGMLALPVLAYFTVPSIQKKVNYVRYDWEMYQQQTGAAYADSGRITSLLAGWEIGRRHPILGVGMGNLRQAVHYEYMASYPDFETPHMPHNQFLFVWAGTGLVGLSLLFIAFFTPLLSNGHFKQPLVLGIWLLELVAFLIEHSVETAMGVAFFLGFGLFVLKSGQNGSKTVTRP